MTILGPEPKPGYAVLEAQLCVAREALRENMERLRHAIAWSPEAVAYELEQALAAIDSVPDRLTGIRGETLRELGCCLGMDDYVPAGDSEYWSVESIHKHVMWMEQRERDAMQGALDKARDCAAEAKDQRDALAEKLAALKNDVEELRGNMDARVMERSALAEKLAATREDRDTHAAKVLELAEKLAAATSAAQVNATIGHEARVKLAAAERERDDLQRQLGSTLRRWSAEVGRYVAIVNAGVERAAAAEARVRELEGDVQAMEDSADETERILVREHARAERLAGEVVRARAMVSCDHEMLFTANERLRALVQEALPYINNLSKHESDAMELLPRLRAALADSPQVPCRSEYLDCEGMIDRCNLPRGHTGPHGDPAPQAPAAAPDLPPGHALVDVSSDGDGTVCIRTAGFDTIRRCSCGALVSGGPTRCMWCANNRDPAPQAPARDEPWIPGPQCERCRKPTPPRGRDVSPAQAGDYCWCEHGYAPSAPAPVEPDPSPQAPARDESVPPPGWERYTFRDEDGVEHEAANIRRKIPSYASLAGAWVIYDSEHGYAPSAPAPVELPEGWRWEEGLITRDDPRVDVWLLDADTITIDADGDDLGTAVTVPAAVLRALLTIPGGER